MLCIVLSSQQINRMHPLTNGIYPLNTQSGCIQNKSNDQSGRAQRRKKKRRVSLNQVVAVIPIPMRSEYSKQTKEKLWSSPHELYENAVRNGVEFASEGWNWRTVKEDEHMIYCETLDERIHPIHIHNLLVKRGIFPGDSVTLRTQRDIESDQDECLAITKIAKS